MTENKQIVRKIKSVLGMADWNPYCILSRLLEDDNCDLCACYSDSKVCSLLETSMLELR